jgi:hypothetical protein
VARAVRNTRDLARSLRAVSDRPPERRPSLLAFFLFDERRSHQIVQDFARQQFSWLDRLAASNRMILFFFLPEGAPDSETLEEEIFVAYGEQTVANPSLEVARRFELRPDELPGVVFFTELDVTQPGPHEGVFWPLKPELFEGDAREAENAFSHLFSLVQGARAEAGDPTPLLATLRRKIEMEHSAEPSKPVVADTRRGALKAVTFRGALSEATRFAFAQGLG